MSLFVRFGRNQCCYTEVDRVSNINEQTTELHDYFIIVEHWVGLFRDRTDIDLCRKVTCTCLSIHPMCMISYAPDMCSYQCFRHSDSLSKCDEIFSF